MSLRRRVITSPSPPTRDPKTYLSNLGFQFVQRKNKEIAHIFLNSTLPQNVRQTLLTALENRLIQVPKKSVTIGPIRWERPMLPPEGPLTIQFTKLPRNSTHEDRQGFLDLCRYGVIQHMKVSAYQAPTEGDPQVQCLINNFRAEKFVPQLYFAGYDPEMEVYIKVMAYAPGMSPSQRTNPRGLAAIERALYTLWLRNISLQYIDRRHIVLDPKSLNVRILDFKEARKPTKNTTNVIASSRNPMYHQLWDPPAWFLEFWNQHPADVMEAERGKVWVWATVCESAPPTPTAEEPLTRELLG
jgi:hypothetical protein